MSAPSAKVPGRGWAPEGKAPPASGLVGEGRTESPARHAPHAGLVVAIRRSASTKALELETIANEVRAAIERASVGGAHLVGVSADGASFAFDDGALEDAIDLAISYASEKRWKIGVGQGALAPVADEGAFERLSIGPGASRATALARAAAPGEALVDWAIAEAREGALLSLGRRVASDGGHRVRGVVLDVGEPWRRDGGEAIAQIKEPRLVGREGDLEAVRAIGAGGLAIVRAAPGVGGSRFLEELHARSMRALRLGPVGCSVDPFGALRVAIGLDERPLEQTMRGPAALQARAIEAARRLVDGKGVDIDAAGEILTSYLAGGGDETPLLLVDDAMGVDRATLEAIGLAAAAPGSPFGVVARIDQGDVVPAPLAGLVVDADITLRALLPHEAAQVLDEACGGPEHTTPEVKKRWLRRGGGLPLAIVESLRHGLALGELAIRDGIIAPRSKTSGRGRTLSPHGWLTRRLAALGIDRPIDAMVMTIVATAGPAIDRKLLEEMAGDLELPHGEALDVVLARLVREGMLTRTGVRLSPSSRTLREAATERADDGVRRRLHGALAAAIARTARGLDLAEGAHHAALAGDHLGAAALAVRASERAKRAGLTEWADALTAFARAEGHDVAPSPQTTPAPPPMHSPVPVFATFKKGSVHLPTPREPDPFSDIPESLDPDLLEEVEGAEIEAPKTLRTPTPPSQEMEPPTMPRIARPSLAVGALSTGQLEALPPVIEITSLGLDPDRTITDPMPMSALGRNVSQALPAVTTSPEGTIEDLAEETRKSLRTKGLVGLDGKLAALEALGGSTRAIARLRGLALLARKEIPRALGMIRRSRLEAQDDGERARGALAYAIALGALGRRDDAILEALDALAIDARNGGKGAAACKKLIAVLVRP